MPEPLAALDAAGKAAVLSYDVPEPISYSGRNFIEIPLSGDAFTTVVVSPKALPGSIEAEALEPSIHSILKSAPRAAVVNPVHLAPDDGGNGTLVASSSIPVSDRLSTLTAAEVVRAADAELQTVLFTNVAGQLDFRMARRPNGDKEVPERIIPKVALFMSSPKPNTQLRGSRAGVTFTANGRWDADNAAALALTLKVDDRAAIDIPLNTDGTWTTQVTITNGGLHTLRADLAGSGWNSLQQKQVKVHDAVTASVSVALDQADSEPAPVLPTLAVRSPDADTSFVDPTGVVAVKVEGTATAGPEAAVTSVVVTDRSTGASATATPGPGGTWSTEILLDGVGRHDLSVTALDDRKRSSIPVALVARVLAQQAFRRLKSRLLLVESVSLSSFLGSFGAGRVIKTFSLLPGEEATISVKSWTKSAESRKAGSSIVDSDATESASSFDDALTSEQSSKEAQSEAFNYKVGATASAAWGWGSASINAEFSGSANSAREEAVKNVSSATRKHSMKASSNRNVTVNTEYTTSQETGTEESTTRKVSNINASRTLNFVFRQMNQEHITLIHLTNVRIALYTEDLMLDANGAPAYKTDPTGRQVLDIRPQYVEVALPQLQSLLDSAINAAWHQKIRDAITFALSGIPDYQDTLQEVFEWVTPLRDGKPVPGATYLRFPRNLTTDFTVPSSGKVITVPGIVLAHDQIVMRTEGVMVDSVLGQGEGLDTYSQGLQEVSIAERRMAIAERQAELDRQELARELVATKDAEGAEIFAQVFPPVPEPRPAVG
jgi:hypothetical protein